jgi:hypothetical protein
MNIKQNLQLDLLDSKTLYLNIDIIENEKRLEFDQLIFECD